MDAHLHADRLLSPRIKRTYRARLAGLPDGAMIERSDRPWLVLGPDLLARTHAGYHENVVRDAIEEVTVLTPRATVATITAGYQPVLHPSATAPRNKADLALPRAACCARHADRRALLHPSASGRLTG
jgi:hypothetical protein